MARATDYNRRPGQIPLNCECQRIPSGRSELILCKVRGEQQHTDSGIVAEVSSIARDEHTLCDQARHEEGSDVGKHQESCMS